MEFVAINEGLDDEKKSTLEDEVNETPLGGLATLEHIAVNSYSNQEEKKRDISPDSVASEAMTASSQALKAFIEEDQTIAWPKHPTLSSPTWEDPFRPLSDWVEQCRGRWQQLRTKEAKDQLEALNQAFPPETLTQDPLDWLNAFGWAVETQQYEAARWMIRMITHYLRREGIYFKTLAIALSTTIEKSYQLLQHFDQPKVNLRSDLLADTLQALHTVLELSVFCGRLKRPVHPDKLAWVALEKHLEAQYYESPTVRALIDAVKAFMLILMEASDSLNEEQRVKILKQQDSQIKAVAVRIGYTVPSPVYCAYEGSSSSSTTAKLAKMLAALGPSAWVYFKASWAANELLVLLELKCLLHGIQVFGWPDKAVVKKLEEEIQRAISAQVIAFKTKEKTKLGYYWTLCTLLGHQIEIGAYYSPWITQGISLLRKLMAVEPVYFRSMARGHLQRYLAMPHPAYTQLVEACHQLDPTLVDFSLTDSWALTKPMAPDAPLNPLVHRIQTLSTGEKMLSSEEYDDLKLLIPRGYLSCLDEEAMFPAVQTLFKRLLKRFTTHVDHQMGREARQDYYYAQWLLTHYPLKERVWAYLTLFNPLVKAGYMDWAQRAAEALLAGCPMSDYKKAYYRTLVGWLSIQQTVQRAECLRRRQRGALYPFYSGLLRILKKDELLYLPDDYGLLYYLYTRYWHPYRQSWVDLSRQLHTLGQWEILKRLYEPFMALYQVYQDLSAKTCEAIPCDSEQLEPLFDMLTTLSAWAPPKLIAWCYTALKKVLTPPKGAPIPFLYAEVQKARERLDNKALEPLPLSSDTVTCYQDYYHLQQEAQRYRADIKRTFMATNSESLAWSHGVHERVKALAQVISVLLWGETDLPTLACVVLDESTSGMLVPGMPLRIAVVTSAHLDLDHWRILFLTAWRWQYSAHVPLLAVPLLQDTMYHEAKILYQRGKIHYTLETIHPTTLNDDINVSASPEATYTAFVRWITSLLQARGYHVRDHSFVSLFNEIIEKKILPQAAQYSTLFQELYPVTARLDSPCYAVMRYLITQVYTLKLPLTVSDPLGELAEAGLIEVIDETDKALYVAALGWLCAPRQQWIEWMSGVKRCYPDLAALTQAYPDCCAVFEALPGGTALSQALLHWPFPEGKRLTDPEHIDTPRTHFYQAIQNSVSPKKPDQKPHRLTLEWCNEKHTLCQGDWSDYYDVLFTPDGTLQPTVLPGSRPVFALRESAVVQDEKEVKLSAPWAYAKVYPALPGLQQTVDAVWQRVGGRTHPTVLAKLTHYQGQNKTTVYPIQLSHALPYTLAELAESKDDPSLETLSLKSRDYGLHIVLSLILGFEDHQFPNLGVNTLQNAVIYPFDAEHVFQENIVVSDKHWRNHYYHFKIQQKNALYCFPLMTGQIDPLLRVEVLLLDPLSVWVATLKALKQVEQDINSLFKKQVCAWEDDKLSTTDCRLLPYFPSSAIPMGYTSVHRVQAGLRNPKVVTWFDLLKYMDPLLHHHYRYTFDHNDTIVQRFNNPNTLPTNYPPPDKQHPNPVYQRSTLTPQNLFATRPIRLEMITEEEPSSTWSKKTNLEKKIEALPPRTVDQAQSQLQLIHKAWQQLMSWQKLSADKRDPLTLRRLCQLMAALDPSTKILAKSISPLGAMMLSFGGAAHLQEQFFKAISWPDCRPQEQKHLLKRLTCVTGLRRLWLKNWNGVTNIQLQPLVKHNRTLQYLVLTSCPYIDNESVRLIAQYCPALMTLYLDNTAIQRIGDTVIRFESGALPFKQLYVLSVRECLLLKSIRLNAPLLHTLKVDNTPRFVKLHTTSPLLSEREYYRRLMAMEAAKQKIDDLIKLFTHQVDESQRVWLPMTGALTHCILRYLGKAAFQKWLIQLDKVTYQKIALMTDKKGETIGHFVAQHLGHVTFLEWLSRLGKITCRKLALIQNNNKDTLGHLVAQNLDSTTFLAWLERLGKATCRKIALIKNNNKKTIGHWAAQRLDSAAFLVWLKQLDESTCRKIALMMDDGKWTIGHYAARRLNAAVFREWLSQLDNSTCDKTAIMLTQNQRTTIGHLVAQYLDSVSFLMWLACLDSLTCQKIASTLDKEGWTIGHRVVRYLDSTAFLSWLKRLDKDTCQQIAVLQCHGGYTLSHMVVKNLDTEEAWLTWRSRLTPYTWWHKVMSLHSENQETLLDLVLLYRPHLFRSVIESYLADQGVYWLSHSSIPGLKFQRWSVNSQKALLLMKQTFVSVDRPYFFRWPTPEKPWVEILYYDTRLPQLFLWHITCDYRKKGSRLVAKRDHIQLAIRRGDPVTLAHEIKTLHDRQKGLHHLLQEHEWYSIPKDRVFLVAKALLDLGVRVSQGAIQWANRLKNQPLKALLKRYACLHPSGCRDDLFFSFVDVRRFSSHQCDHRAQSLPPCWSQLPEPEIKETSDNSLDNEDQDDKKSDEVARINDAVRKLALTMGSE